MVCQESVRIPRAMMRRLTWGNWRDWFGATSKIKMISDKVAELGEACSDRLFDGVPYAILVWKW